MSRPGDLDRRLLLIRDRMLDGCPEMARLARLLQGVSALVLVLSVACVPSWLAQVPVGSPSPTPLPDTSAQQAVVHQYLDLVAAERYADAWQLLTPERQRRETPEAFAADWRAWGRVVPEDSSPFIWPAAEDQVRAEVCHSPRRLGQ